MMIFLSLIVWLLSAFCEVRGNAIKKLVQNLLIFLQLQLFCLHHYQSIQVWAQLQYSIACVNIALGNIGLSIIITQLVKMLKYQKITFLTALVFILYQCQHHCSQTNQLYSVLLIMDQIHMFIALKFICQCKVKGRVV